MTNHPYPFPRPKRRNGCPRFLLISLAVMLALTALTVAFLV